MANHQRLRLPIGIQTFSEIREGDYYYVDKTPVIECLVHQNKYYFLSRPRRFGKSLLLDTLRCLFEGRQSLFEGLYIHDRWDWKTVHPVIRLSFGDGVLTSRDALDIHIHELLNAQAEALDVSLRNTSIAGRFRELIHQTHQRHGERAVLLIDEYDKPILDNIRYPERARELREGLKNLYSVLKDADPHLHLVLLTGVSKFSKVSLFSGLNNLRDITLLPDYTTLCGYTDEDLDTVFAPELPGLDRDAIRQWYNGYRWGGQEVTSVYNPFDVLLLLQNRQFGPYWFESATPTFLVEILKDRGVFTPALTAWHSRPALLSRFDVEDISTDALLFQTGYLTLKDIHEEVPNRPLYKLGLPNQEVEISLNEALLPALGVSHAIFDDVVIRLPRLLKAADMAGLEAHMKALYAGLPHDWYRNNPIAQYEGHYASVFYSHFAALGVQVTVEDSSHHGKVDMAVDFAGHIYLFEFKVVEQLPEGKALAQIKAKGYAEKYRATGKPIHLIGVEFSRERRQIVAFDVETI
ncbi:MULTISPECIES: ATP-binding protein [unclassified Ectothiorhodospira]|uniref:ATP-binding protein n=1 Tax=unclassified Ectothiorhodospira TaxID=2684909 RepID=UPI001EE9140B|nr:MULTISPECIES: ATP-binding protein [unclassified Ectothiorhodospira]MCG5517144.1 ATP-binding protein [Ectothiorhodospira sp. 9100]MCG5520041.1 ATP-binding protein [Ectothiorhodospira sp. 9905]